ncbi:leucyl/phenylalanyl-tRNA--protein transferase [Shewanella sp. WXL01]|uniref:leucyl/phenylalanyl-tRNA--protein transferase n=1 Tax=Shewanella sp. WXL01 TaxID=2709721 RepID=UPI0014386B96|nr:leucyl/phenylalanyl-tRNA--protein transferase [Shewanella sp. WXL01]
MNALSYLNPFDDFPDPNLALSEPNGLLAVGGQLTPERLEQAYFNGIFPWFNVNDPILWWSPDPRAVFTPKPNAGSKSLIKYLKKQPWRYTINHAFEQVIEACAGPRQTQDGTWITKEIQLAYIKLHQLGRAHSVEVWSKDELIGGLYGINVGKVFCGESMFHHQTNASKAAFFALNRFLVEHDFKLIDAQIMNPHLQSLGAVDIPRVEFLSQLNELRHQTTDTSIWQAKELALEF